LLPLEWESQEVGSAPHTHLSFIIHSVEHMLVYYTCVISFSSYFKFNLTPFANSIILHFWTLVSSWQRQQCIDTWRK